MVPLHKQVKSDKFFKRVIHMAYRGASSESSQLLLDVDTVRQRVCSVNLIKNLKENKVLVYTIHISSFGREKISFKTCKAGEIESRKRGYP